MTSEMAAAAADAMIPMTQAMIQTSTGSGKPETMLMLRWVLIIATAYMMLFSSDGQPTPSAVSLFVAAYFASNVILSALVTRGHTSRLLNAGIIVFDTAAICVALALTTNVSRDFFVLYFIVLFLAALTERVGLVVLAAVISTVLHLGLVAQTLGLHAVLLDGYLLRIPFLFVVALFFSNLVHDDRHHRDQLQSEFLSTVSHDLKSPLGVVQSLAELLLDGDAGPLSEEQADLIRQMHVSTHHALTLAHNLLGASRIEAGNLVMHRLPERIELVMEKVLSIARSASDLKHLTLCFAVDADVPLVDVDRLQLERAVNNIIDNAIKNTPDGGTVDVTIERRSDVVAIIVRDDGPGIPPAQLPHLFEKYGSRPRNSRVEGSGLGLFIVKAIVEAHGGEVQLDSVLGRGTTVRLLLPLKPAPAPLPSFIRNGMKRRWWRSVSPETRAA
jgi:signal transduction histidine kinase